MCASKAKEGIHSLLPISRQVLSHLQESRASWGVAFTWEDQHHNPKCLPFPVAFIAEHAVIWSGISLWSVGVSCPSCVPSQLLLVLAGGVG